MTESGLDWARVPLACPLCRARLPWRPSGLECSGCGAAYPIVSEIPRFVRGDEYAASFGFEWNRHRTTQLDSVSGTSRSRDTFTAKTGLTRGELTGKLVLDVGVGSGRFAEVAAEMGARVVGIDLSSAVEAAADNLAGRTLVLQADLFAPPFPPETFDIVYSIGVLHHTPETRAAFHSIARLVRPGGTLAVWVYARSRRHRFSDAYRRLTTRLDTRTLYRLSRLVARLHPFRRVPLVGRALSIVLPFSGEENLEWRALDTFDWYAPRYQWKHTDEELERWFEEGGFDQVERLGFPVAVRGRKRPVTS